jgi:hypothetical protein
MPSHNKSNTQPRSDKEKDALKSQRSRSPRSPRQDYGGVVSDRHYGGGTSPGYGSTPECALGSDGSFTLYIGYVHGHIPAKMVFSVFRKLGLGKLISGEDAVTMIHRPGRNGQRDHQSVKISFEHPFLRGRDGATNANYINHILKRDDAGEIVSTGDSFQLVYQEARTNKRTGKEEPDRHWEVRYWSDASPAVAGKSTSSRPKVTLVQKATARTTAAGADGFKQVKGGRNMDVSNLIPPPVLGAPVYGGAFSGLDQPESPHYSPQSPYSPTEVELDEAAVAFDAYRTKILTAPPTFNLDGTLGVADAEIQAAGEEFLAESALAEEGVGNLAGTHPDQCDMIHLGVPINAHYAATEDPEALVEVN